VGQASVIAVAIRHWRRR